MYTGGDKEFYENFSIHLMQNWWSMERRTIRKSPEHKRNPSQSPFFFSSKDKICRKVFAWKVFFPSARINSFLDMQKKNTSSTHS